MVEQKSEALKQKELAADKNSRQEKSQGARVVRGAAVGALKGVPSAIETFGVSLLGGAALGAVQGARRGGKKKTAASKILSFLLSSVIAPVLGFVVIIGIIILVISSLSIFTIFTLWWKYG